MKIERELERKLKEKIQKARLEKVLAAADLKLKTDVKTLQERVREKRDKGDEVLANQQKAERINQRKADRRREEEDKLRNEKL